jgi:hypothetical protein
MFKYGSYQFTSIPNSLNNVSLHKELLCDNLKKSNNTKIDVSSNFCLYAML